MSDAFNEPLDAFNGPLDAFNDLFDVSEGNDVKYLCFVA